MDLEAKTKGKRKSRYFGSFISPLWASVSLCVEWEGRAAFESVISLPKHVHALWGSQLYATLAPTQQQAWGQNSEFSFLPPHCFKVPTQQIKFREGEALA